ncbi:SRP40, domain-containing protein [Purpureocillium lavendulum]|uniref:SRP40, domain-containing protein n=1 Tax=Purpureocillium lavendulum TaxID=1247861 RepID=A0AB34FK26_9HYPO|nr:SRP40, domain-containing protein [Purpureocillium lavendulum]
MVSSSLILALVRLTNAANLTRFNIMRGPKVNSVGIGYNLVETDGCGIGEKSCDSNYCIPLTGSCCSIGDGSYCKVGKYCVTGGCCQIGKVCSDGGSGSCDTGEKACGIYRPLVRIRHDVRRGRNEVQRRQLHIHHGLRQLNHIIYHIAWRRRYLDERISRLGHHDHVQPGTQRDRPHWQR